MGNETTKANKRRKGAWLFNKVFSGKGIDIGGGKDCLKKEDFPNIISVDYFDKLQGDAQDILSFRDILAYDFVYSSHCLEHLPNISLALNQWWLMLKYNGYLILSLPDEDLYEQGRFQARSRWSREHKHSFTIYKNKSWCHWSINILDMIKELKDCQIIHISLVDTDYDYSIPWGSKDQSMPGAEVSIEVILRKVKDYGN